MDTRTQATRRKAKGGDKVVLDIDAIQKAIINIKSILTWWESGQLTLSETHSYIRRQMTASYDNARLVPTDKRRIKKHPYCFYRSGHCPHIGYDSRGRDLRDLQ